MHIPNPEFSPAACHDCDWHGNADDSKPVRDFDSRWQPGARMPIGDCPDCAGLVYPVLSPAEERAAIEHALAAIAERLEQILEESPRGHCQRAVFAACDAAHTASTKMQIACNILDGPRSAQF